MNFFQILLLLCCTMLFFQCKKEVEVPPVVNCPPPNVTLCQNDPFETLSIEFVDISLSFPSCFSITPLQGIDSYIGEIKMADESILIHYDVASINQHKIPAATATETRVQGCYHEFRYETKGSLLYFIFPDARRATFYTAQLAHQADLIELFKTLKLN